MSVEKGLNSTVLEVIKDARATAKGKVTKNIKSLKKALVRDATGKFLLDKIDEQLVQGTYEKLDACHDTFHELHERFSNFRVEEKEPTAEAAALLREASYSEQVSTDYSDVIEELVEFKRTKEKFAQDLNVMLLADATDAVKKYLDGEKETAKLVIDSQEVDVQKTAILVKEELSDALTKYTAKVDEYKAALKACGGDGEAKFTPAVDYSTEIKEVGQIKLKLAAIAIKHRDTDESIVKNSNSRNRDSNSSFDRANSNMVKLQKMSCPKFSGSPRDFGHFKREFQEMVNVPGRAAVEIGSNLREAVPDNFKHLLSHLETSNHKEMMKILEKKFGPSSLVIQDVVSQMDKMKMVTTDKGFIDFVEKLEKMKLDLEALKLDGEVANAVCITKLESKLPMAISTDWGKLICDEDLNEKPSKEKFDRFMIFLKKAKDRVDYQASTLGQTAGVGGSAKGSTHMNFVTGVVTLVTKIGDVPVGKKVRPDKIWKPCFACDVDGATDLRSTCHPMESCSVWNGLSQKDRERKVKCLKHPFRDDHTTQDCTMTGRKCKLCSNDSHHFLLCSKKPLIKSSSRVAKVSSMTAQSEQAMLPVMVQAQFVSGLDGSKIGTLMDLCSTDDYVTHRYAKKHHLSGETVEVMVEGMGGKNTHYETKMYMVPIMVKGQKYEFPCYGMDKISSVASPPKKPSYNNLCSKFDVKPSQMRRPSSIDLLISMRQNFLHPSPVKTIDRIVLYDGPLGKVFGGHDPDLVFTPHVTSYPLSMHRTTSSNTVHTVTMRATVMEATYTTPAMSEKKLLDYFLEENIGVECRPRCGGCRCGKCATGAKQMSIKDEKEYEHFKSLMHLEEKGTENDPGPYWETFQPWVIDKTELVGNKPAVLGVMNSTMKKLNKEPHWRQVYEQQLLDLIEKKFAREVTEDELEKWINDGGKSYYISHQVALNPSSKSTPVRVVFNSSQKFRGFSLNTSWELGPDVLNSLHGVLVRFRKDYVGGQGDVKKMYYMVRIAREEQFMQLFLWQFPADDRIRTFCMTRLVMGNKPSGGLSMVAMRETADLGDNALMYPAAYETITRDAYVDNVFRTAPDIETLKRDIADIEKVSAMGGFYYKDWIISGQDIPEQLIGVQLPNAIAVDEERALGINWDVINDQFYMKSNLAKPGKKRKKTDVVVTIEDNSIDRINIKPYLTIRACLSLHAKTYDPLGLVLPTRMFGNILFRETLQLMKKERQGKIPWDEEISDIDLKKKWFDYFEMLLQVDTVKFARCVKPPGADVNIDPDLVTFCDGNPDAFGVAAYVLYELEDGGKAAALLMSKAKLGPLTHKGETVKNELCGATFASRIKIWIVQESGIHFKDHHHFLDSMIVLDMMKKLSYGFNTFAGLRVGEIQQKTNLDDWHHIPSKENISDVLTRGATPDKLGPGSVWQSGPAWLTGPRSQWPVTCNASRGEDYDEDLKNQLAKFSKKSQTSAANVPKNDAEESIKNLWPCFTSVLMDDDDGIDGMVIRCGKLQKLIRSVAYLLRWAGRASRYKNDQEEITIDITASEYQDAYNCLIYLEQRKRLDKKKLEKLVPRQIIVPLKNYDRSIVQIVIGGRVKNFPIGFSTNSDIPIIPYGQLAKLIVLYHHQKHHKDVDTVVAIVRKEVWIIKARKIASEIDSKCKICKEKRKSYASQKMGDLPIYRSQMLPSFSVVCMDLFGPQEIRDDVVKRGPRKYKKVWGVIYTCTSTRAVHLDVATDYSTEAVLHTVRRLMSIRGDVRRIISDPGSQLVRASKELTEWRQGWDQNQLIRFGASKGLDWKFIMANSQHQNGAAEVMVKMVKSIQKSLFRVMGDTKLSLNEMFTLLAEVSNLINERPIGIKPNDKSGTDYLSPNSLLLGRCSARISAGPFEPDQVFTDNPKAVKSRFLLVQAITNQFWKVWLKLYFPSLLIRQKWHADRRNIMVGDICLLKDSNVYRGEWRLCEVAQVFPDDDGKVRNVQVMIKPKQSGTGPYISTKPIYLSRHVNNLIVLVPADEREDQLGVLHGPQQDQGQQGQVQDEDVDRI